MYIHYLHFMQQRLVKKIYPKTQLSKPFYVQTLTIRLFDCQRASTKPFSSFSLLLAFKPYGRHHTGILVHAPILHIYWGKKCKQLFLMGFPVGGLWSIRSFNWQVRKHVSCLKWPNGYLQVVKRNKIQLHSDDLICWAFQFQTLFNWKGGNLVKYDFQLKLYEKGEHNIQF